MSPIWLCLLDISTVLISENFLFFSFGVSKEDFCVYQTELQLRDLPSPASQILGLKAYTTTHPVRSVILNWTWNWEYLNCDHKWLHELTVIKQNKNHASSVLIKGIILEKNSSYLIFKLIPVNLSNDYLCYVRCSFLMNEEWSHE